MSTSSQSPLSNPLVLARHDGRASGRTVWIAAAIVLALHIAALAVVWLKRDPEIKVAAPRVVTATLISPEPAPVPVPVPVAQPKPVEPPKVVHKVPPKVIRRPTPKPLPVQTDKPSTVAAAAPTPPAPPAPAAPAAPPTPAPAPAPAIDPNIPKDVRHLTCVGTPPEYPALSRRRGESGTVVIQFVVDTHGNVESARVKSSSGFDRLDEAARQAALHSPCTPYMEGGQAVKAITQRPYSFSLNN